MIYVILNGNFLLFLCHYIRPPRLNPWKICQHSRKEITFRATTCTIPFIVLPTQQKTLHIQLPLFFYPVSYQPVCNKSQWLSPTVRVMMKVRKTKTARDESEEKVFPPVTVSCTAVKHPRAARFGGHLQAGDCRSHGAGEFCGSAG